MSSTAWVWAILRVSTMRHLSIQVSIKKLLFLKMEGAARLGSKKLNWSLDFDATLSAKVFLWGQLRAFSYAQFTLVTAEKKRQLPNQLYTSVVPWSSKVPSHPLPQINQKIKSQQVELWVKYMQISLIRTGFSSFPSQKSRVLYPQGFLAKNHTKDSQVNVYNSLLLTGLDCANLASVDEYLFTVVTEVFVRLFCGCFFFLLLKLVSLFSSITFY